MKTTISILFFTLLFSVSCQNTKKTETTENPKATTETVENVPYTVGARYFVNNTVADSVITKTLSSKEDFEQYFGMATVMGEDGKPTPIDFATQFVIAVIEKASDKDVTITPISLSLSNDKLALKYKTEEGTEQRSFTTRTGLVLVVDKKYEKETQFEVEK